jgi:hypothetical protein
MSVNDLKSRMADIPGIDGLTMHLANGRQVFTLGNIVGSVGAFASDQEIEDAIRAAIKLPSVGIVPMQSKETAMSITGAAHVSTSLKDMLAQRKQAMADGHAKLQDAFAKMDQATAALNSVGDKVAAEADDLLASVGQFTNSLGGE